MSSINIVGTLPSDGVNSLKRNDDGIVSSYQNHSSDGNGLSYGVGTLPSNEFHSLKRSIDKDLPSVGNGPSYGVDLLSSSLNHSSDGNGPSYGVGSLPRVKSRKEKSRCSIN